MNWANALAGLLTSGPARFPDPMLVQGAKLLTPEERPPFAQMVSLEDLPEYAGTKKRPYDMKRVKDTVGGLVQASEFEKEAPTVRINRDRKDLRKPMVMAGVLAHEGVHARRRDASEPEAYEQQYKTLKRLGYDKKDWTYMDNLLNKIAMLKQMRKE